MNEFFKISDRIEKMSNRALELTREQFDIIEDITEYKEAIIEENLNS